MFYSLCYNRPVSNKRPLIVVLLPLRMSSDRRFAMLLDDILQLFCYMTLSKSHVANKSVFGTDSCKPENCILLN